MLTLVSARSHFYILSHGGLFSDYSLHPYCQQPLTDIFGGLWLCAPLCQKTHQLIKSTAIEPAAGASFRPSQHFVKQLFSLSFHPINCLQGQTKTPSQLANKKTSRGGDKHSLVLHVFFIVDSLHLAQHSSIMLSSLLFLRPMCTQSFPACPRSGPYMAGPSGRGATGLNILRSSENAKLLRRTCQREMRRRAEGGPPHTMGTCAHCLISVSIFCDST